MTQIIRIPHNYDGERCRTCWRLMRENLTYQEAKADHVVCHGWIHCGWSCCGPCPHCGGNDFREDY